MEDLGAPWKAELLKELAPVKLESSFDPPPSAVDRAFGGPETLDRRKRRTVWDAGRSGSVVKGEDTGEDSRGYFKIAWENLRCFAT
jgi:hypothetical protein